MEQSWEVLQCLEYQQGVKSQFYSNEITSLMFFGGGKQKTASLPPIQITASLVCCCSPHMYRRWDRQSLSNDDYIQS